MAVTPGKKIVLKQACRVNLVLLIDVYLTKVTPSRRKSPQPAVRASALRALSRIDTAEAAEIVLGVLEHGSTEDRASAVTAIREACGA